MKLLRTAADILRYAADHAPTAACARQINEGRAGIEDYKGGGLPGWIVTAMSRKTGHVWKILIRCDEETRTYPVEYLI